jgi:hypothetical protein
MNTDSTNPGITPDPTGERVMGAIHRQQRLLKWLTVTAVIFWIIAVVASLGVLVCYSVFYEPKEKQMLGDYGMSGHLHSRTNAPGGSRESGKMPVDEALAIHFTMNYVVVKGVLAIAVALVVLSGAMLATLLLVHFNRRVTLRQINHGLAQISEQLKQLREAQ